MYSTLASRNTAWGALLLPSLPRLQETRLILNADFWFLPKERTPMCFYWPKKHVPKNATLPHTRNLHFLFFGKEFRRREYYSYVPKVKPSLPSPRACSLWNRFPFSMWSLGLPHMHRVMLCCRAPTLSLSLHLDAEKSVSGPSSWQKSHSRRWSAQ